MQDSRFWWKVVKVGRYRVLLGIFFPASRAAKGGATNSTTVVTGGGMFDGPVVRL